MMRCGSSRHAFLAASMISLWLVKLARIWVVLGAFWWSTCGFRARAHERYDIFVFPGCFSCNSRAERVVLTRDSTWTTATVFLVLFDNEISIFRSFPRGSPRSEATFLRGLRLWTAFFCHFRRACCTSTRLRARVKRPIAHLETSLLVRQKTGGKIGMVEDNEYRATGSRGGNTVFCHPHRAPCKTRHTRGRQGTCFYSTPHPPCSTKLPICPQRLPLFRCPQLYLWRVRGGRLRNRIDTKAHIR